MRLLLLGLYLFAVPASAAEVQVRLVLEDGSLVKGLLLGQDAESLLVEGADGKALELPRSKVRKAFDAASGEALDLGRSGVQPSPSSPKPPPTAQPEARPPQTAVAAPLKADWDGRLGIFDIGLHWGMDYSIGDDTKMKRLWEQMIPSQKLTWSEYSSRLGMSLGIDGLLTPFSWLAVGPFADWHFWAPGAEGSLKWTSSGYAYFNGYYWTVYPAGSWITRHELSLQNVVYGVRTRARFRLDPNAPVFLTLGVDVGQVALSGAGYKTYTDNSLKQQAEFTGQGPALGLSVGVNVPAGKNAWLQADLAWQSARIDQIVGTVKLNDYVPAEEGRSVTVVDTRNNSNITADFSSLRVDVSGGVRF